MSSKAEEALTIKEALEEECHNLSYIDRERVCHAEVVELGRRGGAKTLLQPQAAVYNNGFEIIPVRNLKHDISAHSLGHLRGCWKRWSTSDIDREVENKTNV